MSDRDRILRKSVNELLDIIGRVLSGHDAGDLDCVLVPAYVARSIADDITKVTDQIASVVPGGVPRVFDKSLR